MSTLPTDSIGLIVQEEKKQRQQQKRMMTIRCAGERPLDQRKMTWHDEIEIREDSCQHHHNMTKKKKRKTRRRKKRRKGMEVTMPLMLMPWS